MAGSQENQRPRRRGRGQSQYNFSLPSDKKIVVLDPNISLAAQSIAASAATATVVEDAAKDSRDTNNAPVGPRPRRLLQRMPAARPPSAPRPPLHQNPAMARFMKLGKFAHGELNVVHRDHGGFTNRITHSKYFSAYTKLMQKSRTSPESHINLPILLSKTS